MTFYLNRERYDTFDLTFTGIPAEANREDVPSNTLCTFTVGVVEDLVDSLRQAVGNPVGFDCEVANGHYRFRLRDCKLTGTLPDRDYGSHRLLLTFATLRQNILEAQRPLAPPPPPDQTDVFLSQLHLLTQDHDLLRRKRLSLAAAFEELEGHRATLDAAEKSLELKKAALFATGTPDLILIAKNRGL